MDADPPSTEIAWAGDFPRWVSTKRAACFLDNRRRFRLVLSAEAALAAAAAAAALELITACLLEAQPQKQALCIIVWNCAV